MVRLSVDALGAFRELPVENVTSTLSTPLEPRQERGWPAGRTARKVRNC
jgi:hypothetical protein